MVDDAGVKQPLNASDAELQVSDPNLQDAERAKRLRVAVKLGGGRTVVASRAGIHPQSLTRYLAGRDIQSSTLVALADACGVSVEWLATGRGNRVPASEAVTDATQPADLSSKSGDGHPLQEAHIAIKSPGREVGRTLQFIPLLKQHLQSAFGEGVQMQHEQIVEYYAYDETYIVTKLRRRPQDLILVEARGAGMEPVISPGDILTVDIGRANSLEHDQLYVLNVGPDLIVKRIERRLSGLVLHSENPRYAPEAIGATDIPTLQVLGQVILVSAPPR